MYKYKVLKERGGLANISVVNIDTEASVIIGRPTVEILNILHEKEGYTAKADDSGFKYLNIADVWNLDVRDETAKLLADTTMKMKRPVRIKKDKSEQPAEPEIHRDDKQPVDVFDLIFGIKD